MRDFAQLQTELQLFPLTIIWENSQQTQTMWSFPIINVSSSQATWRIIMGVCEHQKTTAKKRLKEDSRHKTESWALKHVITVRKKASPFHTLLMRFPPLSPSSAHYTDSTRRHSRTLDLIQTVLRFYFLKFLLIWWWWNENFHLLIEYTTSLSSFFMNSIWCSVVVLLAGCGGLVGMRFEWLSDTMNTTELDDTNWPLFGWARIIFSRQKLIKMMRRKLRTREKSLIRFWSISRRCSNRMSSNEQLISTSELSLLFSILVHRLLLAPGRERYKRIERWGLHVALNRDNTKKKEEKEKNNFSQQMGWQRKEIFENSTSNDNNNWIEQMNRGKKWKKKSSCLCFSCVKCSHERAIVNFHRFSFTRFYSIQIVCCLLFSLLCLSRSSPFTANMSHRIV